MATYEVEMLPTLLNSIIDTFAAPRLFLRLALSDRHLALGDRVLPGSAIAAVADANELPLPSRPLARRPFGLQWTPSALKAFSALGGSVPRRRQG